MIEYRITMTIENQQLFEKILKIEKLLEQINSKMDNFLGIEELAEDELNELQTIHEEIDKGEYIKLEELTED